MLDLVAPSGSPEDILYHPCLVTLKDGRVIDRVYVQEAQTYIQSWGVWPEQGSGKWSLPIEAVAMIESSPTRLPARIATEIYKSGESGMGFNIFTLIFADGQRQAYSFGNAVDFVIYPRGKARTMSSPYFRTKAGMNRRSSGHPTITGACTRRLEER